jgi:DNA replication protein DnaC
MARLATIKTLPGFDFSFQPSLDRERVLVLAELQFVDRREVVHFLGPPGTASRTLPWRSASKPSRRGAASTSPRSPTSSAPSRRLSARASCASVIRWFCRAALLIVDEIGYLPVVHGGGNLFFQLVNARYEKGAMILTSNRGFAEWGDANTVMPQNFD